jgi:hypothetical protein
MRSTGWSLSALALCVLLAGLGMSAPAWSSNGGSGGGDDGGGSGGGGGGEEALKLRLNDAIGAPGGTVALVIRTYAARPLRQGRITVRVRKPTKGLGIGIDAVTQPARPLTYLSSIVFSTNGDVRNTTTATNAVDSQSVGVDFTSSSASVNAADGPLAVIFMRLGKGVAPGSVYDLDIDPAATGLTDALGVAIAPTPIQGRLRVRASAAPYALAAEGDEVAPGATAELGVETVEPFAVYGGRITFRFDPAAAGGAPVVKMDPRYGASTFTVDRSEPGLLVVSFRSPKGTLNAVPGRFLAISLPTSAGAAIGTSSAVRVDPTQSWLLNRKGRKLAVTFEAGTLSFR